jgi:BirA family biotin operon repressor/biotin-[acetyl-CoA-carboxylase] ligase
MISRPITEPDSLNLQRVQELLNTRRFGRPIRHFQTLPSTNRYALENAGSGELQAGDVIIAETQTAGYGRQGSRWHSSSGAGLWFSILLDTTADCRNLPLITLIGASAILEILRNIAPADWILKWPNDIYANGKKVAGLLAEVRSRSGETRALVLGMGINVNQNASQFDTEIRDRAVSLAMLKGKAVSREPLLASLLNALEQTLDWFQNHGTDSARKIPFQDDEILFKQEDRSFRVRMSAHHPDGSMIFTSDTGQTIICDQGERCAIQPAGS